MSWHPVSLGDLIRAIDKLRPDRDGIDTFRRILGLTQHLQTQAIEPPHDVVRAEPTSAVERDDVHPEKPAREVGRAHEPVGAGLRVVIAEDGLIVREGVAGMPARRTT